MVLKDIGIRTEKGFKVKRVSEENIEHGMEEFERAFPDGVFTEYVSPKNIPHYRYRDLYNYCLQKSITPEQLSDEEWEKFRSDSE